MNMSNDEHPYKCNACGTMLCTDEVERCHSCNEKADSPIGPFMDGPNVDPKTGRHLDTLMMDPTYPGVVFPGFEERPSPYGAYIVRKGDLWWSARCVWRDGHSESGMFGVQVECRDSVGNIVAWARSPHVWPLKMKGAGERMWQAANALASREEGDAVRRARMGIAVRAIAREHGVTLHEEAGVDERGVRRVGVVHKIKTPSPYYDSVRPFGSRQREDDLVLMPRPRKEEGLSGDVGRAVDLVTKDVANGVKRGHQEDT
jgi:hypothetical protein